MGTRTVQIIGKAYSTTGNVSVVCNFNGVEVYNGAVTTTAGVPIRPNTSREVLFSFTVQDTLANTVISSSFVVTNGTMFLAGIQGDASNPVSLATFNIPGSPSPKTKTNITLDGVLITALQPSEGWHYEIADGSTLTVDWDLTSKLPATAPGNPGVAANGTAGVSYQIVTTGDTDFTLIGAADSNVGTIFTATGPGVGTGTIVAV